MIPYASTDKRHSDHADRAQRPTIYDPLDFDERARLIAKHPIVQSEYLLPTPPLKSASDFVVEVISTRRPGVSFASSPRFGKTKAISYLEKQLPTIFPDYPIISFIGEQHRQVRENQFFRQLYGHDGQTMQGNPSGWVIHERLVRKWFTLAEDRGTNTIVFLGDEMQRLSVDEMTWLIDIGNALERSGIRVIWISFGSAGLVALRNVLITTGRSDIIGRFMSPLLSFKGVSSMSDLRLVLKNYDDQSVRDFPEGSGCCFTQFFLPKSYASGWRLEEQAGRLWGAFEDVARDRGLKTITGGAGIGMQWIAHSVEQLLIHTLDFDRPRMKLSDTDYRDAVEASGFGNSLGILFQPGSDVFG